MPIYDFSCSRCRSYYNDQYASYEDYSIPCPSCDGTAKRIPVYRNQGIIVHGGPNAPMPPRGDTQAVQEEYAKEVRKRGWTAERSVEELRKTKFTDATGQLRVDTKKLPQTA